MKIHRKIPEEAFYDALVGRAYIHANDLKDYMKAIADFTQLLTVTPKSYYLLSHRASAYMQLGEYDQAIADFSAIIEGTEIDFTSIKNKSDLSGELLEKYLLNRDWWNKGGTEFDTNRSMALMLQNRGSIYLWNKQDEAKAVTDFTEALRVYPSIDSQVPFFRATIYQKWKQYDKAAEDFALIVERGRPEKGDLDVYPSALSRWAWQLATASDANYRDGKKAMELALQACETPRWQSSYDLDALAAAYAENGQFDEAVAAEEKAIAAVKDKNSSFITDMQARLILYAQRRPFRDE